MHAGRNHGRLASFALCASSILGPLHDAARKGHEERAESSVRVVVEDGRGQPLELDGASVIAAWDGDGVLTLAEPSDRTGVVEFAELAPGSYWLSIHVANHERVVREFTLAAGQPMLEQRVRLEKSRPKNEWLGEERNGGRLIWKESGAEGCTEFSARFLGTSGVEVATKLVACGPDTRLDGLVQEFAPGLIELRLYARGLGRIEVLADGYAPVGFDADFSADSELDLGDQRLPAPVEVMLRVEHPSDVVVGEGLGWRYATRASLERAGWWWSKSSPWCETVLQLGPEPHVVRATATIEDQLWETPLVLLDPRSHDSPALPLLRAVPLVIDPLDVHQLVQLEFLDALGLPALRRRTFVDVPKRYDLIPGEYTLRWRSDGAVDWRTRRVSVEAPFEHIQLAR